MALAVQNQDETYSGIERAAILVMYLERSLAKALLDLMNVCKLSRATELFARTRAAPATIMATGCLA